MKKSTKAVLLSLLVLPGAGHIFLKRYVTSLFLISITVVSLYILVSQAIERALSISDKLSSGEIQLDSTVILKMISDQPIG